jgi:hypothetical protein
LRIGVESARVVSIPEALGEFLLESDGRPDLRNSSGDSAWDLIRTGNVATPTLDETVATPAE